MAVRSGRGWTVVEGGSEERGWSLERRARAMSDRALDWSIRDVMEALDRFGAHAPARDYISKLLAELDAYTGERNRRRAARLN